MARKELKPIRESKNLVNDLRKKIQKFFLDNVYAELINEVSEADDKIKNSVKYRTALDKAIASGKIKYRSGRFEGEFNSHITKALKSLGAQWDKKNASFTLSRSNLPQDIRQKILITEEKFQQTISKLTKRIEKIVPDIQSKSADLTDIFDKELATVDNEIEKRVEKFSVYPKMDKEQRKEIAKNYSNNMDLYIKKFVEEEIVELRSGVSDFIQKGARPEQMRKYFVKRYGVSESKAKFLARQESNLLVTEMQKQQYTKANIKKYIWRTVRGSAASPVRATHAVHDGETYSWDDPPLVGTEHLHPGQDFNCRCVAIPLVEF